ncbi:DUF4815 domain-containing protein [Breoghania sp.]|uniref:DUF4815 domain-containing protein n=1 Tax=Breoghania sp. TaxID=2065378 RepID=UPI0029CAA75F|nr:DUF4815 domain-containing protein [Breoghania sp.]
MTFENPNVPGAYNRTSTRTEDTGVVFVEQRYLQGADLNDMQSILRGGIRRAGELSARDGDRISGAGIVIDTGTGSITCEAGQVYARGDVRPVAAATLVDVPMVGDVLVGVRLVAELVDADTAPELYGLAPGTASSGEPGAVREVQYLVWGWDGDGAEGDLYAVYQLVDGVALDQTEPVELSTTLQAMARYDRDANGSYVVEGCRVGALGKVGGAQRFVIDSGTANINGFKRTRSVSARIEIDEDPDVSRIDGETHTFADGGTGTATLTLRHPPLANLVTALVTKEVTEAVTHGGAVGSIDALANDSVVAIVSVTQGATTYVAGTDYILNADRVDWTPGGAEPATGSSYDVTYQYRDAVAPVATDARSVTVSGGVTGGDVILTYDHKLPRTDLICLDPDGRPVYLKGVSSRSRPRAPAAPGSYLPLAEVANDWFGTPVVTNSGVRAYHYTTIHHMYLRLVDAIDLIALERLRRDIDSREPVAKRGVFVDPFTSDRYRDAGFAQDAAVFEGSCQLAVDVTVYALDLASAMMLDSTPDVIISQPLSTNCRLINPYRNFEPLPASMTIDPPVDFWVESADVWLSPQTQALGTGNSQRTTTETIVNESEALAEFLRARDVDFEITNFGAGEILSLLTFDGADMTPDPALVADAEGTITGTITIPAATFPAGSKPVVAAGAGGSVAGAMFVGQGTITTRTMQQVTTVTRWQAATAAGVWQEREAAGGNGGGSDPLAQTFTPPQARGRHIGWVDIQICAIGDPDAPVLVEIRATQTGLPTFEIVAQAVVDMSAVAIGGWTRVPLPAPVWLDGDREWSVVVLTNDDAHAIASAEIGAFDATAQRYVSAQPYSVGVMLSSSNANTWTPHQKEDLCFQIVACTFPVTERIVPLGVAALVDCTDLMVSATVELPTADCSVVIEIERPGGTIYRLAPGQVLELDERITETVTIRAVLTGTATASPVLYPGAQLIAGSLRETATYVSRAFDASGAARLPVRLKALLPSPASFTVELEDDAGAWQVIPLAETEVLEIAGWTDRTYEINPLDPQPTWGAETRVRLTLTGTPAARPSLADLRAATI